MFPLLMGKRITVPEALENQHRCGLPAPLHNGTVCEGIGHKHWSVCPIENVDSKSTVKQDAYMLCANQLITTQVDNHSLFQLNIAWMREEKAFSYMHCEVNMNTVEKE